jgi:hypothetical protein
MKNPVYTGTMAFYATDYGATLFNQMRFKFIGEPNTDNDTELPRILGGKLCFTPSSDAQEKCLPRRNPIEARHFILTFNIATHKMPVDEPDRVYDCGRDLVTLPLLKCIGYNGESVRNLQLLVGRS